MGQGIDLARLDAAEHAAVIDNMKDQLILVLIARLGGKLDIPVAEIDGTGDRVLMMSVVGRTFHFELRKKQ
jgi:hypothetical protein